jgi:hypothetical protein
MSSPRASEILFLFLNNKIKKWYVSEQTSVKERRISIYFDQNNLHVYGAEDKHTCDLW